MRKKIVIDKAELKQYYIVERHSYSETCTHFGVKPGIVDNMLREYGLKRSGTVAIKLESIPVEKLTDLYIKQNKSIQETGQELGLTGPQLRTLLKKHGIRKEKNKRVEKIVKAKKERPTTVNREVKSVERKQSVRTSRVRKKAAFVSSPTLSVKVPENIQLFVSADTLAALLDENKIEYERDFTIDSRKYDFKVGKTLIEINSYATHNSTWALEGKEVTKPDFHQQKTIFAVDRGYRCINVWDWDDMEKVVMQLFPRKPVYARKCELREISQYNANLFCKKYHMQGGSKMQTECYALFLGDEMIEVMTFGEPRFNRRYQWELIRLCTKTGYRVIGGAERLYKYFIEKINPENLISYCDHSKFSGEVYIRLGLDSKPGTPSRHWFSPGLNKHFTDNGIRMRGYDLLVGNTLGKKYGKGTVNDDLLREHGFVELYDAGQGVYTWKR